MNVSSMFPIKNTSKVSIDKAKYIKYNDIDGTRAERKYGNEKTS